MPLHDFKRYKSKERQKVKKYISAQIKAKNLNFDF